MKEILDALDTYIDLLENRDNYSEEEIEELIFLAQEKINNKEYFEESMSVGEIVDNYKILHDIEVSEEFSGKGLVVLLDNYGENKTVLDGNHRLNYWKTKNRNKIFEVIILDFKL